MNHLILLPILIITLTHGAINDICGQPPDDCGALKCACMQCPNGIGSYGCCGPCYEQADGSCSGVQVDQCDYSCGGVQGIQCPTGYKCIDDKTDKCDPDNGGADCAGICAVTCTTDTECGSDKWCRAACDDKGSVCVPFASVSDHCGGFTLPCWQERCPSGMTCFDTTPLTVDDGGICVTNCGIGYEFDSNGECVLTAKCEVGDPLTDEKTGEELYCGRGGIQCPDGSVCNIHPTDIYAVCCPEVPTTTGDTTCEDKNAVYSDCPSGCGPETCDSDPCFIQVCGTAGCVCKPGYVLGPNKECIPRDECQTTTKEPIECKDPNAEMSGCTNLCPPTCEQPISLCKAMCAPPGTCECKSGFVLGPNDVCITQDECPADNNPCEVGEPLQDTLGEQLFCGRGTNSVSCPDGSTCNIAPNDIYAVCCADVTTTATPVIDCETCEFGYNNGCQDCTCNADGTEACDNRLCITVNDRYCLDPTCDSCPYGYFDGCNNCECDNESKLANVKCETNICKTKLDPYCKCNGIWKDGECVEINCNSCDVYNDGCNDCVCQSDGTVSCTKKACLIQGEFSCVSCIAGYQLNEEETECENCNNEEVECDECTSRFFPDKQPFEKAEDKVCRLCYKDDGTIVDSWRDAMKCIERIELYDLKADIKDCYMEYCRKQGKTYWCNSDQIGLVSDLSGVECGCDMLECGGVGSPAGVERFEIMIASVFVVGILYWM